MVASECVETRGEPGSNCEWQRQRQIVKMWLVRGGGRRRQKALKQQQQQQQEHAGREPGTGEMTRQLRGRGGSRVLELDGMKGHWIH